VRKGLNHTAPCAVKHVGIVGDVAPAGMTVV
jgi:hypothetical protein